MSKTITLACVVPLCLTIAACGSAAAGRPATLNALSSSANSASAAACEAKGGSWDGTACDTSQLAPSTSPAQETDPNGQTCDALDSLGYCPGDDPSPMQQWCSGNGYSDFQQVQQDLSQLSTDSGNDDLAAVEQDGSSLFQDAHTAGLNLPPLSNMHKVEYGVWMGYLLVAGYRASNGDLSGASSAMASASKYTSIITYVSNQCGGTS